MKIKTRRRRLRNKASRNIMENVRNVPDQDEPQTSGYGGNSPAYEENASAAVEVNASAHGENASIPEENASAPEENAFAHEENEAYLQADRPIRLALLSDDEDSEAENERFRIEFARTKREMAQTRDALFSLAKRVDYLLAYCLFYQQQQKKLQEEREQQRQRQREEELQALEEEEGAKSSS